jgi:hypothetical protein
MSKQSLRVSSDSSANAGAQCFSKARPLARRIGVCPKTLFRWADRGLISRHKVSARTVLFDANAVLAFVGAARVDSPPETIESRGHGGTA